MKVRIVCVGKLRETYFKDAIAEYAKRISRWAKWEIVEVAEEPLAGNSKSAIAQTVAAESARLAEKCRGYVIALDRTGEMWSSEQLAQRMQSVTVGGCSEITFLIGGSWGMDDSVLRLADARLSFGKLTFPHTLMRVVLAEQIYRAFSILEGSGYHK